MATNSDLADAPFSDEQREWLGRLFSHRGQSPPSATTSLAGQSPGPSRIMARNLELADAPFSDEQREWLGRLFSHQDQYPPSATSSGVEQDADPPRRTDPSTGECYFS